MSQVLLRLQSNHIRSRLAKEIEIFDNCIGDILEHAQVFTVTSSIVPEPTSTVIVEVEHLGKTAFDLVWSSNAILEYLNFQKKETGLASGGDPWLKKKVKAGQQLVQNFLETLILYKKSVDRPGADLFMKYFHDIRLLDGAIVVSNRMTRTWLTPAPHGHILDVEFSERHHEDIMKKWHFPHPHHPAPQVPGSPWHKYFGNIQFGSLSRPILFRGDPQWEVRISFPQVSMNMEREIQMTYGEYRRMFSQVRITDQNEIYLSNFFLSAIDFGARSGVQQRKWYEHHARHLSILIEVLTLSQMAVLRVLQKLSMYDNQRVDVESTVELENPHENLFRVSFKNALRNGYSGTEL